MGSQAVSLAQVAAHAIARRREPVGSGLAAGPERPEGGQAATAAIAPDEALLIAVESDDAAGVRSALAAGADVEHRDEQGRTPLMVAMLRGHQAVYAALREAGASFDAVDHDGVNAASYLRAFGAMGHEAMARRRSMMLRSIASLYLQHQQGGDGCAGAASATDPQSA